MTPHAIETVLGQTLEAATDYPVVYQNAHADEDRPWLDFQNIETDRRKRTLAADGDEIAEGYLVVTVVTDRGGFTTPGLAVAEEVRAAFVIASRLDHADGGTVLVTRPPRLLPRFVDGDSWRTPVRIDWRTE